MNLPFQPTCVLAFLAVLQTTSATIVQAGIVQASGASTVQRSTVQRSIVYVSTPHDLISIAGYEPPDNGGPSRSGGSGTRYVNPTSELAP